MMEAVGFVVGAAGMMYVFVAAAWAGFRPQPVMVKGA